MLRRSKLIWLSLVVTLLFLTGCSQNQQEIFNAAMNQQNIQSIREHTSMNFKLSGTDFDPSVQQQIDTAALFLNNGKLDLDIKASGNAQKTASKEQIDMNLALQGMNMNMSGWVDSDLSGNMPKVTEIFKLPAVTTASLPPQFSSKNYMVITPFDMNNPEIKKQLGNIDITKFMEFNKNFQSEYINFLNKYAKNFNPQLDVVNEGIQNVQTPDGIKPAAIYELKLNDAQLKEFVRYTVDNFVQDKDAMEFVKNFMYTTLEFSQVPDREKTLSDFEQAFNQFETNRPQFLAKFNEIMDQLNNVSILGDKGLDIKYAISGGYIVNENGMIDLKLDLAKITQFMNYLNGQQGVTENQKGIVNFTINFNTDVYDINKPLVIQMPEINSNNSFNYVDLINSMQNSNPIAK